MSVQTNTPTPFDPPRGEGPPLIDTALLRSGVYSILAQSLSPPLGDSQDRAPPREALRRLGQALEALGVSGDFAAQALDLSSLETRYAVLFGHTVRGRVCAYETEYGAGDDLFLQTRELTDIGAFLSAFGLKLDRSEHERADHVRCECELMGFLARKEAYARETNDEAMLAETTKAQRLFLRDHLGRFAPALGAQLEKEDHGGFYGFVGGILKTFIERECARVDVTPGGTATRLRLPVLEDAPMACGRGEAEPDLAEEAE